MQDTMAHILIIDDDTRIRELLWKYLQEHGFFVSTAKSANEAYEILRDFTYDLLIVDIMMPGETGIEFTHRLRQHSTTPVLMLTAMGEAEDRIAGLESGADDYLPKPFEPRELLLRIERILNRTRISTTATKETRSLIRFGMLEFDLENNRLTQHNTVIPLTSGEAKLLSTLIQHRGTPVSREQLAELCGGVNERSIDVQIIRLRTKIEADPKKPLYLQTIRGEGYVLYS